MSDTESLRHHRMSPIKALRPRLRLIYTAKRIANPAPVFSLPPGETLIGRKLPPPHSEIVLPDDTALSSVHARVTVGPEGQVTVTDLGSKNGSFVGRIEVPDEEPGLELRDGEVLRVGSSFFVLRHEAAQPADAAVPALIGDSPAIRALRARVAKLAREAVPVLLHGETGTGKDVVAAALHAHSGREGELFAVNCAAIAESLAESELFGHAAHAFNDARRRQGAFLSAHEKTLFLDEIADLPHEIQPKLLRALEEGKVRPVGSDTAVAARPRIVSATHQDLAALVETKDFRSDLYNRIAHVVLRLPPLRERREDILTLLVQAGRVPAALPPDLVEDLLLYDWRGNVRELLAVAERIRIGEDLDELRDFLRRSTGAGAQEVATPAVAGAPAGKLAAPAAPRPHRLATPGREELVALLEKHAGVVKTVAEELNCSRRQVQRWLQLYKLEADSFRRGRGGS